MKLVNLNSLLKTKQNNNNNKKQQHFKKESNYIKKIGKINKPVCLFTAAASLWIEMLTGIIESQNHKMAWV